MNIPEFTAQASLYRTSNSYRSLAFDRASPQRTVLLPQLGGPGFEGKGNCISDCVDLHPDWTAARCGEICRDPGSIPGSGSGQTRDWASKFLCDSQYAYCVIAGGFVKYRPDLLASCLFGGPCSCEELRDACLK
jgi:hypothetical protein